MKTSLLPVLALAAICLLSACAPATSDTAPVHADSAASAFAPPVGRTESPAPAADAPSPAPASVPEAEPAPVYEAAPAESDVLLTLDGQPLTAYAQDGALYLALEGYAAAAGAQVREKIGAPPSTPSCAVTTDGGTQRFTMHSDAVYDGERWFVPLETALNWTGGWTYTDVEENHLYCSSAPRYPTLPEGCRVPVLMYHAVSDDCWGYEGLFVSPADLETQLQLLVDEGCTPIWFEDLPHADQYEKPVILTFDDGYADNYTELFPLLKKYNVKATIFVIADHMGIAHKMTAEQAKELSDSGLVSIQSHTMTHGLLDTMNAEELTYQLAQSQLAIARMTGRVPTVVCYPEGRYSQLALEVAARYYTYGTTMEVWCYTTDDDPLRVARYAVMRDTDIWTFRCIIDGL